MSDYVEFAMDAVQVFPVLLLPIVGSVFAFSSGVPSAVPLSFLLIACVVAIAMTAWIMSTSPSSYVSRKWHGYSVVTLIGMAVNILGIILVAAFG